MGDRLMARTVEGGWNPNDMIARAIDTCNVKLVLQIVDKLRGMGCTYHEILQRVQAVRPDVTQADWDNLICEGEDAESGAGGE